jgi:hypothetical protein
MRTHNPYACPNAYPYAAPVVHTPGGFAAGFDLSVFLNTDCQTMIDTHVPRPTQHSDPPCILHSPANTRLLIYTSFEVRTLAESARTNQLREPATAEIRKHWWNTCNCCCCSHVLLPDLDQPRHGLAIAATTPALCVACVRARVAAHITIRPARAHAGLIAAAATRRA